MELLLIILVIIVVYFLPTIIAWNKRNVDAIIALNLFLGWTFLGWVAALVWALTKGSTEKIKILHIKEAPADLEIKRNCLGKEMKSKELIKDWRIQKRSAEEESAWTWLTNKLKK